MIWLRNKIVTFKLSSQGKQELQDFFNGDSFSALVVDVDTLGFWLVFDSGDTGQSGTTPSYLLKGEYVATASVEVFLGNDEPEHKRPIGFQG